MLQTLLQFLAWILLAALSGVLVGWALGRSRPVVVPAEGGKVDSAGSVEPKANASFSSVPEPEITLPLHLSPPEPGVGAVDLVAGDNIEKPSALAAQLLPLEVDLDDVAAIEVDLSDVTSAETGVELSDRGGSEVELELSGITAPEVELELPGITAPEAELELAELTSSEFESPAVAAVVAPVEVDLPVVTSGEVDLPVVTSVEVDLPVVTSGEVDLPVVTSVEVETPVSVPLTDGEEVTPLPSEGALLEPVETEGALLEPVETEGALLEPVETEGVLLEPVETEGARLEPDYTEHIRLLSAQVNQFRVESYEVEALVEELESQIQTYEIESISSRETIRSLRSQLQDSRTLLKQLGKELDKKAETPPTIASFSASNRVKRQVAKLKQENSELRLQVRESTRLCDELSDGTRSDGKTAALQTQLDDLLRLLAERDGQLAQLRYEISSLNTPETSTTGEATRIVELEAELRTVRTESMVEIDALTKRLCELTEQQATAASLVVQVQELKLSESKAVTLANSLEQERRELQQEVAKLRIHVTQKQTDSQSLISKLEDTIVESRSTITSLKVRLAECQSRLPHPEQDS